MTASDKLPAEQLTVEPETLSPVGFHAVLGEKKRGEASPAADPVKCVGFLSPQGREAVLAGDEGKVIKAAFERLSSPAVGEVFVGAEAIERDLSYLVYRAMVLGITTPPELSSLCASAGRYVPETQGVVDFARCWGRLGHDAGAPEPSWKIYLNVLGMAEANYKDNKSLGLSLCEIYQQMAGACGYRRTKTFAFAAADTLSTDYEHDRLPTIDVAKLPVQESSPVAFFQWLVKPLANLMVTGPRGRGWGRTAEETRENYPFATGRFDPTAMRVCGFVAQFQREVSYCFIADEKKAIESGTDWLARHRLNGRLFISEPSSWRFFTAARAMVCGIHVPHWILGGSGRRWISPSTQALPAYGYDFCGAILRHCVECGAMERISRAGRFGAPVWVNQSDMEEQSRGFCRAAYSLISRSPYIKQIGASPIYLELD